MSCDSKHIRILYWLKRQLKLQLQSKTPQSLTGGSLSHLWKSHIYRQKLLWHQIWVERRTTKLVIQMLDGVHLDGGVALPPVHSRCVHGPVFLQPSWEMLGA